MVRSLHEHLDEEIPAEEEKIFQEEKATKHQIHE